MFPELNKIAEDYLELFYKFIWWKMKSPEIDNFGQKFFNEYCDVNTQLNMIVSFIRMLEAIPDEVYLQHLGVLQKYIPDGLNQDMLQFDNENNHKH